TAARFRVPVWGWRSAVRSLLATAGGSGLSPTGRDMAPHFVSLCRRGKGRCRWFRVHLADQERPLGSLLLSGIAPKRRARDGATLLPMPIEGSAHCQVCADLQRQHSAEGKAETTARLRRATVTIAPRDGVRRLADTGDKGAEWA